MLPLVSLIGLLQLAVSGLTALLIVYAVLSWVPSASSMLHDLIARLAEPLVRPLRRFIPLIGGVDLSPLAAIVLLQVVAIVLGNALGWPTLLALNTAELACRAAGVALAVSARSADRRSARPRRRAGAAAWPACWRWSCAVRGGR